MIGRAYLNPTSYAAEMPPCPLCGGNVSAESCHQCFAPVEVIDSILERRRAPKYIGIMGPSGVGKTVYLGMLLDLLSKGAGGFHGLARGSFSLALHRNVLLALERQRFPEKTPSEPDRWQWVHCEVSVGGRGRSIDLVTPDVAGEAVLHEIETPRSNLTIRAIILRCSALVVLIDTLDVIAGGQGQEMFAMQLLTYLDSLHSERGRKITTPVALVFTKADLCHEAIEDPEAFALAHAPALHRFCEARLKTYRFFRSGIAGSCAQLIDETGYANLVPLRIEPHGVIEPFAWLHSLIC